MVTITAYQHFAVNRWNPNYSGTLNKQPAATSSEKSGASAEKPGGGEAAGAPKGEAQGIFLCSLHSFVLIEPDLHLAEFSIWKHEIENQKCENERTMI